MTVHMSPLLEKPPKYEYAIHSISHRKLTVLSDTLTNW